MIYKATFVVTIFKNKKLRYLSLKIFFNYVHMCMSVCWYVQVSTGACGNWLLWSWNQQESVSCLTRLLGTEPESL